MHDTAMLLGLLGWDSYREPVELVTDYFASSGYRSDQRHFSLTALKREEPGPPCRIS